MFDVSLALTHYERYDMLLEAIAGVRDDPRLSEIVVADDHSTDGSFEKLLDEPGLRIVRNSHNLDCYQNKAQAVRNARFPWVILFDSDNILGTEYLDAVEKLEPDPATAYLPTFARPEFDYRPFAGETITRKTVGRFVDEPMFLTALNTANYLVHRDTYLDVWTPGINPVTADSIYMNLRWLATGGRLCFVAGMEYEHRIHEGSHFMRNHTPALEAYKRRIEDEIRRMR